MAMTTCRECKAEISTQADACPKCGAKIVKTSGCAWIAAIFFGFVGFSALLSTCTGDKDNSAKPLAAERLSAPTPKAAPPPSPEVLLKQSTETVDEVEARLKSNADRLKKYYGTSDQVKEATADLVKLAVVKGIYGDSHAAQEKKLSVRADSLIPKVAQQQRKLYASVIEEIFVKNGMDIRVTVSGSKQDQLRLRYVLMSKPLVYKFQNEMKLDEQARNFGFKRIVFSDGYDESWTIDL